MLRPRERTLVKTRPNEPCWCGSGKKYKKCHRDADRASGTSGDADSGSPELGSAVSQATRASQQRRATVEPGRVGPMRVVPEHILRPEYAATGNPSAARGPHIIQTDDALQRMRTACRTARAVLDHTLAAVRPGITTDELDALAHEETIRRGAYPSPLNYHGYPKSICTSVNEVICHGIPDSRALVEGDIVNVDVTVYIDGMHGDCSETALVGAVDSTTQTFVERTRQSLYKGIEVARPGQRTRDIGRAIDDYVIPFGYQAVRDFVGHGIGRLFHMDPQVPHYTTGRGFRDAPIRAGMTFTIEPMINLGTWRHTVWDDDWTAVTEDLQLSAQFEHTLLITEQGPEILTLRDGEEQPFLDG